VKQLTRLAGNITQNWSTDERPIVCREGALDMIDMLTAALDIGIMTGIVMLVAFGLMLRY
jgi:hypothetical protein